MPQRLISSSGAEVAKKVRWARSSWARMRGLLGEPELEPDVVLVLTPASQIHTFFMRYHLDVALCDREWRVLWVRRSMPPNRVSVIRKQARFAIEMRAGTMPRWIEPDMHLLVVE